MPKDDTSPFTPGQPVPVEFFVGRIDEIQALRTRATNAASSRRLQVVFLTGERGIGKSSLASFVRFILDRDHRILGVHTFLGGVSSLEEMVRRIFDRLLKASVGRGWFDAVKGFLGGNVREVGLFGVSVGFGASARDLSQLVDSFAPTLRNLMERLKDDKDGVLLVLDDINGLATSLDFAHWIKSLIDEIATSHEALPFCLVLVGTEDRRQALVELQPSLARAFNLIDIQTWSDDESRAFYRETFEQAGISVHSNALEILSRYAGGLPVLAHEIGDAAFNLDADGIIDADDALSGVVHAANIVGRKHLRPQVFRALRSEHYRRILNKLAKMPFQLEFERAEILKNLSRDEQRVFDNFLRRMKDLGVIVPDEAHGRGAYRFSNLLHYLYFWMQAAST